MAALNFNSFVKEKDNKKNVIIPNSINLNVSEIILNHYENQNSQELTNIYEDVLNDNNSNDDEMINQLDKNIIYTYIPKRNQMVIFDSCFNEEGILHSVTKIKNWNRSVYRIYFKLPKKNKNKRK